MNIHARSLRCSLGDDMFFFFTMAQMEGWKPK